MNTLANIIVSAGKFIRARGSLRLVWYLAITLAVALCYMLLPSHEIGFIYNGF